MVNLEKDFDMKQVLNKTSPYSVTELAYTVNSLSLVSVLSQLSNFLSSAFMYHSLVHALSI